MAVLQTRHSTLDEIRALPDAAWQVQASGRATLGITESAYWLRVPVVNHTPDSLSLIAELGYSQLDDVTFHVIAGGELVRTFQTGDRRPFHPAMSTTPTTSCVSSLPRRRQRRFTSG